MKIDNNESYTLSTGKIINPNRGIIGLSESEGFKIFEGYDGFLTPHIDAYDMEFQDLTNEEAKEIALYMSKLWKKYADKITKQ